MKKMLFAVLGTLFLVSAAAVGYAQQANLPVLTSKDYAEMKKDDVYVILFSASYCGACRLAKQNLFPELMEEYASDANVHFYMADVEKDVPDEKGTLLKDRWSIVYLPTFVVIYNDAVMYSKTGYADKCKLNLKRDLENQINRLK